MAKVMSMRGTCGRAKVGCVLTVQGRIVATGYNGPIDKNCDGVCDKLSPCTNAVHAEANAIAFAARNGIALAGATLYCTHTPCLKCAELIVQSGITEVHIETEYRLTEGKDLLLRSNIKIWLADLPLLNQWIKSIQS